MKVPNPRSSGVEIQGWIVALAATGAFVAIIVVAVLRPSELTNATTSLTAIATLALAIMTVEANRTARRSLGVAREALDLAMEAVRPVLTPYVEKKRELSGGVAYQPYEVGIKNIGNSIARNVRVMSLGDVPWLKPGDDGTIKNTGTLGVGQSLPLVALVPTFSGNEARYPAVEVRITWSDSWREENSLDVTLDPLAYINREIV